MKHFSNFSRWLGYAIHRYIWNSKHYGSESIAIGSPISIDTVATLHIATICQFLIALLMSLSLIVLTLTWLTTLELDRIFPEVFATRTFAQISSSFILSSFASSRVCRKNKTTYVSIKSSKKVASSNEKPVRYFYVCRRRFFLSFWNFFT